MALSWNFCLYAFVWILLVTSSVEGRRKRCPFIECGQGRIQRKTCTCKCPPRWDPATNCQKNIGGLQAQAASTVWPDVAFTLPAGGPNVPCPEGFSRSRFESSSGGSVTWDRGYDPNPDVTGSSIDLCSRDSDQKNWNVFPPGGAYCVLKSKDVYCSKLFSARTFVDVPNTSLTADNPESAAEVTEKDGVTKFVVCCRRRTSRSWTDDQGKPMMFPNSVPFRLFSANKDSCPTVEGMRSSKGFLEIKTSSKPKVVQKGTKSKPYYEVTDNSIKFAQCHFQPPVYGCSQEIQLNNYVTSVTITTPTTGNDGHREPDRRCFYYIKAPRSRKLSLEFKTFDMDKDDIITIQPNNAWGKTTELSHDSPPNPIRTTGQYLLVEWWASHEPTSKKGVEFEVTLKPDTGSCQFVSNGGKGYMGEHDYTEYFERCMPWSEMTHCPNYPVDEIGKVWNLHGHNKCRDYNRDAVGPWCYINKACQKQLCDVCNTQTPYDILPNCEDLVKDPEFCTNNPYKTLCFESCKMEQPEFNPRYCTFPVIPDDGSLLSPSKYLYEPGDRVKIVCNNNFTLTEEMLCVEGQWTALNYACEHYAGGCQDRTDSCAEVLSKFPMFCSTRDTYLIAKKYCFKSCGNCEENAICKAPESDTYKTKKRTPTKTHTGRTLIFECRDGFILESGDLIRMCGTDGELLGQEPVCVKEVNKSVDVNVDNIFKQSRYVTRSTLYLFEYEGKTVPIPGKITNWYAYCLKDGTINAFIYRKKGNKYQHIGTNKFLCEADRPTVIYVPPEEQIEAQTGDIMGFMAERDRLLSAYVCSRSRAKPFRLPSKKVNSVEAAEKLTSINANACLTPSIGFRVSSTQA